MSSCCGRLHEASACHIRDIQPNVDHEKILSFKYWLFSQCNRGFWTRWGALPVSAPTVQSFLSWALPILTTRWRQHQINTIWKRLYLFFNRVFFFFNKKQNSYNTFWLWSHFPQHFPDTLLFLTHRKPHLFFLSLSLEYKQASRKSGRR